MNIFKTVMHALLWWHVLWLSAYARIVTVSNVDSEAFIRLDLKYDEADGITLTLKPLESKGVDIDLDVDGILALSNIEARWPDNFLYKYHGSFHPPLYLKASQTDIEFSVLIEKAHQGMSLFNRELFAALIYPSGKLFLMKAMNK